MSKLKRPQFFAMYKDFNDGKIKPYDVLGILFDEILTEKEKIIQKNFILWDRNNKRIPIRTKEQLSKYIENELRYHYWGNATWEFVVIDWPYRDTIDTSRPVKIDVFDQLEPNIPVITDLVWNYIEDKVKKLIEKESK